MNLQVNKLMKQFLYILLTMVFLTGCNNTPEPKKKRKSASDIPKIHYTVMNQHPHSTSSFTQGLLVHNNEIYESTGSPKESPHLKTVIGILDLETGEIDVKIALDSKKYFGEGITILNNKIYQLTYHSQTCFVYDLKIFELIEQYSYLNEEGWGLTTDGEFLIMSDGTHVLTYRDPSTFEVIKTMQVTSNGYAIDYLNELEYIDGYIYANVWTTNILVKIDPKNGHIVAKIDLTSLRTKAYLQNPDLGVTNGIAYDSKSGHIFVTGKLWPQIYEIKLLE